MGRGVKTFYRAESTAAPVPDASARPAPLVPEPGCVDASRPPRSARLAIYDSLSAAPRTIDVDAGSESQLIEDISSRTYSLARELGGDIPYTVIREVSENFIHADFREPVVSVLDGGNTIRFADQGPGIPDKRRAQLPGFTTASLSMKQVVRGVGSGLPIVKEYLGHSGGHLEIDDNLGSGTVVTIRAAVPEAGTSAISARPSNELSPSRWPPAPGSGSVPSTFPPLSTRQKQVLSLVLEIGEAGPTIVSKELSIAVSTAHRDLAYLEQSGLIMADETGKRVLTPEGSAYLDSLFSL